VKWEAVKRVHDGRNAMKAGGDPAHQARLGAMRMDYVVSPRFDVSGNLSHSLDVLERCDFGPHVPERNDAQARLGGIGEKVAILPGYHRDGEARRIQGQSPS
jgi:hypothetical protein